MPEPRVPLMNGSSHWCNMIFATRGNASAPQAPRWLDRSAPHLRGHNKHASILKHAPAIDEVSRPVRGGNRTRDDLAGAGRGMDKFTSACVDSGVAHICGSIIFEEDQIALLQVTD